MTALVWLFNKLIILGVLAFLIVWLAGVDHDGAGFLTFVCVILFLKVLLTFPDTKPPKSNDEQVH